MSIRYRTEERRPHFVRDWRRARGLSVADLADRIGVSNATLSRIETGKQPYTQDTLEALADALSCRPADLITEADGNAGETSGQPKRPDFSHTIQVKEHVEEIRDLLVALDLIGDGMGGDRGYAVSAVALKARSLADIALDALRAMGAV